MESVLFKQPIILSVQTLKTLMQSFREYTKNQNYSPDMPTQLEETQTAIDLISGCLTQIKAARDELKTLVQQIKNEYLSSSNGTRKNRFHK